MSEVTTGRRSWIAYVVTTVFLGAIVGTIAYVSQTSFLSELTSIPAIPLGFALVVYTLIKPLQIFMFKQAKNYQFYFFVYLLSSILALIGFMIVMKSKVAHISPPIDFFKMIVSMDPLNFVIVVGPLLPAVLFIWLFERATQSIVKMHRPEENA